MIIKQVNLKNWASVLGQLETGLPTQSGVGVPTGAGKECVAQKRSDELSEAVRKLTSEPRR